MNNKLKTALWLWAIAFILGGLGVYHAFFATPAAEYHGELVRILYLHVPTAWLSIFAYTVTGISAGIYLFKAKNEAFAVAEASALSGLFFTLACLVTGSIWGKPAWGVWWSADPRLLSVVILFFLYVGFFLLKDAFENVERGKNSASILAFIGLLDIPLIKLSVKMGRSLHQGESFSGFSSESPVDSIFVLPLFLMTGAFLLHYLASILAQLGKKDES